jgi:hypothetical protein
VNTRILDREQCLVGISAGSVAAMAISFFIVMLWLQIGSARQTSSLIDASAIHSTTCKLVDELCMREPAVTDKDSIPVSVKEFRSRLMLATTTIVSMTLSIIVIVYSLVVVRASRWAWPLLAGGAILIMLYLSSTPPFLADNELFPAYKQLIASVNEYRSCGCTDASNADNLPWTMKLTSNRIGNSLLVLAVIALAVTVWHQILGLRNIDSSGAQGKETQRRSAEALRAAKSRFEFRLYFVSAMLVSSVIAVQSYYSWPASIVTEPAASGLTSLATIITLTFGAGFTLLIMVVFGPAYFAITQKVRELGGSAVGDSGEGQSLQAAFETWQQDNDFAMKAHQRVFGILATAGPVLAGPIMELLRAVSA